MELLNLSKAEIEQDIRIFQERIEKAKGKLSRLPTHRLPFAEHKKREKLRRELLTEIIHVEGLIKIARKGIQEYRNERKKLPGQSPGRH